MLLRVFDYILIRPVEGLLTVAFFSLALVVAITVHEFSHALSATQLGDPTPRSMGRLSLHPLAHLDPLGSAMMLLAGFGWGKPVPVNDAYLRIGPRQGMAVVAMAGPLSNVLVALLLAVPLRAGVVTGDFVGFSVFFGGYENLSGYVMGSLVFWNLLLASFNLIPVAPLDGFKVAVGILPREASRPFAQLEPYGPVILLALIMSSYLVPGLNILGSVIRPIINALAVVVLGGQIW